MTTDRRRGPESFRREVNERVADLSRTFANGEPDPGSLSMLVVCECADPSCTAMSEITLAEYEAVRAEPRQFVVTNMHEVRSDAVVARRTGYLVVEHSSGELALVSWLGANTGREELSPSGLSSER